MFIPGPKVSHGRSCENAHPATSLSRARLFRKISFPKETSVPGKSEFGAFEKYSLIREGGGYILAQNALQKNARSEFGVFEKYSLILEGGGYIFSQKASQKVAQSELCVFEHQSILEDGDTSLHRMQHKRSLIARTKVPAVFVPA